MLEDVADSVGVWDVICFLPSLSLLLINPPPLIPWNQFIKEDCGAMGKERERELEGGDLRMKNGETVWGLCFYCQSKLLVVNEMFFGFFFKVKSKNKTVK